MVCRKCKIIPNRLFQMYFSYEQLYDAKSEMIFFHVKTGWQHTSFYASTLHRFRNMFHEWLLSIWGTQLRHQHHLGWWSEKMSRRKNFFKNVRDGISNSEFDTTLDFLVIEFKNLPWIDTRLTLKVWNKFLLFSNCYDINVIHSYGRIRNT